MTDLTPTEVLDHNDAIGYITATILRDCTQAQLAPVHVGVSTYTVDFWSAQIQFAGTGTDAVDRFADAYGLHADAGYRTNYERQGVIDINGMTVTVVAYTTRPRLAPPANYRPAQTNEGSER